MKSFADTQAATIPEQTANYVKPRHLIGVNFVIIAVEHGSYGPSLVIVQPDAPFGDKYLVGMGEKGRKYAQAMAIANDPDLSKGINASFKQTGEFNGAAVCKLDVWVEKSNPWPDMADVRAEAEYNKALKLEQDTLTREQQEKDGKFSF